MSEKKSFTVKLNEAQREFSNDVLSKAKDIFGTESKGESLFKIIEQWDELASAEEDKGQVLHASEIPDQLEDLCELGFLQRIIELKGDRELWHCLKNQRPDGKGKPIIMADGKTRTSIQKLCEACKQGFVWHEQRSKMGKARAAIQRFGEMEIEAVINCCIHPANNAIQLNLGGQGNFYCKLTDDRVTMNKSCIDDHCDYFFKTSAPLYVKDTEAYDEVQKMLE